MKKLIYSIALLLVFTACNQERDFDATGTFEATEITVSAQSNGQILKFDVSEGDILKAGEQLGTIDTMQIHYNIKQLLSKLSAVDIRKPDISKQIASLEQQLATTQMELQRAIKLVAADAGNKKTVDDLTNQSKLIQSQIEAQKSNLSKTTKSSSAEINAIQYQIMAMYDLLQKCKITNPRTGTVLVKYAEAGEMAAAGKPLYKIADLELIYLRAYITADQLNSIKLNQNLKVIADNGDEYQGVVTWISSKSEFTPKGVLTKDERANLVYPIKVSVKNDGKLKIGQYGEIKL